MQQPKGKEIVTIAYLSQFSLLFVLLDRSEFLVSCNFVLFSAVKKTKQFY